MSGGEAAFEPLRSVELLRVSVPLLAVLRSAALTQATRESIIVRVVDAGGSVGLSECPTLGVAGYATETTAQAWVALASGLAPAWLEGHRSPSPGAPAASAAIADAVLDAELRRRGEPLAEHLGGDRSARTVPWCAVLTDATAAPADAARFAGEAARAGASMLKFKFADPARLRSVIAAVRSVTDLPLAADANGSSSLEAARSIDDLELRYLEQPLRPGVPWSEVARLCSRLATPVCLDESLPSLDAVADALRAGAVDVASVKGPRMGGIEIAAAAVRYCADRDVDCFVGGMLELGIGRAAGLAVAALPGCTLPTDLGPSDRYFAREVCDPLTTDRTGAMVVPGGAGIGRDLEDVPVDLVVDRLVVRA